MGTVMLFYGNITENKMKTHVNLSFGGKDLYCELEYEGGGGGEVTDLEFTLTKVEMVVGLDVAFGDTHAEDITNFLECCSQNVLEFLESKCLKAIQESMESHCIDAIQERGYV